MIQVDPAARLRDRRLLLPGRRVLKVITSTNNTSITITGQERLRRHLLGHLYGGTAIRYTQPVVIDWP
jgi:hypothetical protein